MKLISTQRLSLLFLIAINTALIFTFWYQLGRPVELTTPEIPPGYKLQCASYTPFIGNESPGNVDKDFIVPRERLEHDFALLAQRFSCIRTYATSGMDHLPEAAERAGLKVLLGAWVSSNPQNTEKELELLVTMARAHPNVIETVVVGNETLLRGELADSQLIAYLRQVKAELPDIPVTYADVWAFWLKNPLVATAVDFLTIHILPYWEDEEYAPKSVSSAMNEVDETYARIQAAFPGKKIVIGETGWPSAGRMRLRMLPSVINQARFLRSFVAHAEQMGWPYNLIEAFDQPWKRNNEGIVGGYWGIFTTDRTDKGIFSGSVTNFPHWPWLFAASMGLLFIAIPVINCTRLSTIKSWLIMNAWMLLGALLLVLASERAVITARNLGEWSLILAVLAATAWLWIIGLYSLSVGALPPPATLYQSFQAAWTDKRWEILTGRIRLGLTLYVLILAIGLVFEGRSRDLEHYALFLPALWYTGMAANSPPGGILERLSGVVLIFSALFIVINETPFNWQSNLWVLISLLWGTALFWEGRNATLRPLYPYAVLFFVVWIIMALVRSEFMESLLITNFCADSHWICTLRSGLHFLSYHQIIGGISILLAAVAARKKTRSIFIAALSLAIFSLVIYQTTLGAISLILLGLSLATFYEDQSSHTGDY